MRLSYILNPFSLALLFTLGVFTNVNAQKSVTYDSAKVLLTKIASSYEIDTLQRMNIYCSLFMSDSPTVKIDSLVGNYYIKGKNILARLDNAVFLRNDRWSVSVLNDTQEIYLDSIQNDDKIDLKANPLQMTDTLYYDPENVYTLEEYQDTSVLKVQFGYNVQLTEAILIFNKKTSKLLFAQYKIPALVGEELETSKSYILAMQFDEPYSDESANSIFSERKYISFDEKKQPHGSGLYKDYRVIVAFENPAL